MVDFNDFSAWLNSLHCKNFLERIAHAEHNSFVWPMKRACSINKGKKCVRSFWQLSAWGYCQVAYP